MKERKPYEVYLIEKVSDQTVPCELNEKSRVATVLVPELHIQSRHAWESPRCLPDLRSEGYYRAKSQVEAYANTPPN